MPHRSHLRNVAASAAPASRRALVSVMALAVLLCLPLPALSQSPLLWHLSSPRRDVGAAAVALPGGAVGLVVAGGCADNPSPGPTGPYSCTNSSAAVELYTFTPTNATVTSVVLPLYVGRGWPSVCAVGATVVVAGGGTTLFKTASADVIDVASRTVAATYPQALSIPRWGHGCAAVGNQLYFAGGTTPAGLTEVIDVYKTSGDGSSGGVWSVAPFKLSAPRESAGGAGISSSQSLLFAGGWNDDLNIPNFSVIDAFNTSSGATSTTGGNLRVACYWPGVASVGGLAYILDDAYLNVVNGSGVVVSVSELPAPLAGSGPNDDTPWESGGAVPGPHLPQNGVVLYDCLACFYGLRQSGEVTNAVFCYNTASGAWMTPMNCTAVHKAGAIAGAGNTVFVAGGYDPTIAGNPPTDAVDVFVVPQPAECIQRRRG